MSQSHTPQHLCVLRRMITPISFDFISHHKLITLTFTHSLDPFITSSWRLEDDEARLGLSADVLEAGNDVSGLLHATGVDDDSVVLEGVVSVAAALLLQHLIDCLLASRGGDDGRRLRGDEVDRGIRVGGERTSELIEETIGIVTLSELVVQGLQRLAALVRGCV